MPPPFSTPAGRLGNMAGIVSRRADEPDAELIRLCGECVAAEAEYLRLARLADISPRETDPAKIAEAAEARAMQDHLLYGEQLDRIADLPAKTPEGMRAKAKVVYAFFSPTPPEYSSGGGPVLWSLVCELAGEDATVAEPEPIAEPAAQPASAVSAAPWQNRDKELIALCIEHIKNVRAYGAAGAGVPVGTDEPLWDAYCRTRDAICAARPQNIFGILAIAQAAKAEAQLSDGGEDYGGQPGEFAWQVVNHLVRLGGNAGIPD